MPVGTVELTLSSARSLDRQFSPPDGDGTREFAAHVPASGVTESGDVVYLATDEGVPPE